MSREREFVSRIITDPSLTMHTAIRPADLVCPAYRSAYEAVIYQLSQGVSPSLTSVILALPDFRADLASLDTAITGDFAWYEKQLAAEIQARRLHNAAMEINELLGNGTPPGEVAARAAEMVAASVVANDHKTIRTIHECALSFGPILEDRYKRKGELVGLPSGLPVLDQLIGGIQKEIHYIGARPSHGKTAIMLTMARAMMRAGHSVGIISVESSEIALITRVLSAEAPIFASSLRNAALSPSEFSKLGDAINRLETYKGFIYHNTKADGTLVEQIARRMAEQHGAECIFIDYLQRIRSRGRDMQERVMRSCEAVADISRNLNVAVVCLAQTGRAADHEAPQMSHFQHSSQIEQDADVAMLIGDECEAIHVVKGRESGTGVVPIYFDTAHVQFRPREIDPNYTQKTQ